MFPRYFTSISTKSSCSRFRRPIHPRLNCPSITMPLSGHSSRVTISSPPLTGSLVISGYMHVLLSTLKASDRRPQGPTITSHLLLYSGFVNRIIYRSQQLLCHAARRAPATCQEPPDVYRVY